MYDAETQIVLTDCDREPIHIPGAVQPHGFLLVVNDDGMVVQGAGDIEDLTGQAGWLNQPLSSLIGPVPAERALAVRDESPAYVSRWRREGGLAHDVAAFRAGDHTVVEIEQASDHDVLAVERLAQLDEAGSAFERARTVSDLAAEAAIVFRRLTGFDRVMIYRFLEDDSGCVIAEDREAGMPSFLNHHFPEGDIPKQARALYARSPVRVIPDVGYTPRPLRPALDVPLDMSEAALRSVSPIHLKYLRNMGVRASASISIVMDGRLWGLIACHNRTPLLMGRETRSAAAVLARGLARQLRARVEAEAFRSRAEQRVLEEQIVGRLPLDQGLAAGLGDHLPALMALAKSTGVAIVSGEDVQTHGVVPSGVAITAIADWLNSRPTSRLLVTRALKTLLPSAEAWAREASGLIGAATRGDEPVTLLWFRAEKIETIRWAGDPHEGVRDGPLTDLTPRASFDAWAETVHGQSEPWAPAAIESATRFRDALNDFSEVRALRRRNLSLTADLADRDSRINRQDLLMREVNHRVQNSLQLISSFLALQAREHGQGTGASVLEDARRRVKAVSLVHSRLYRAETVEAVDLSRYLSELVTDLGAATGPDWASQLTVDLAPLEVEPERAVTVGLIFTELMINAQKYAYAGEPGPIAVSLEPLGDRFRLQVADKGAAAVGAAQGFGSRMVESMAAQLGGEITYRKAKPGLIADLTAPARLDSVA